MVARAVEWWVSVGATGFLLCLLHRFGSRLQLFPSKANRKAGLSSGPVVLLTRDKHANGPWLTDLQAALLEEGAQVVILPLSKFRGVSREWRCLVNRVSDAAPPADAKICLAALRSAALMGLPCVNGYGAYALGCSKLNHYQLFAHAGLRTPRYVVLRRGDSVASAVEAAQGKALRYPLLLKPNEGGFGDGVTMVENEDDLKAAEGRMEKAFGEDGLALLQEFARPDGGCTYRVFFLGAEVQCGVRVRAPGFNACVRSAPAEAWSVASDVASSVQLLAKRAGADCGSVELLYSQGTPWYFDFNLLSTLPTPAQGGGPRPYRELARHMLRCDGLPWEG